MKKALSLFLAVLMLFGALSVSAFATDGTVVNPQYFGKYADANTQVIVDFSITNGTLDDRSYLVMNEQGNGFSWVKGTDISGTYTMYAVNTVGQYDATVMVPGYTIVMPGVKAANGWSCGGWKITYVDVNNVPQTVTTGAGSEAFWTIPRDTKPGQIILARAIMNQTEPEEDTLGKILGIMTTIFGALLGIIMFKGDTEAGVAMVQKVLGGISL